MRCPTCLFDAAAWSQQDLQRTLTIVPSWWHALAAGGNERALAPYAAQLADLPEDTVLAVHQAWHALADAGRARHAGTPALTAAVEQLNLSRGGVPKLPVAHLLIDAAGPRGDVQAERRHHGRPWQAVCLWSAEVIDGLAREGHPIGYGSAGENVTVRGLPWAAVLPGVRLQVGGALLEVTTTAIPCRKNARWFSDGRFRRLGDPGRSRMYARVLVPGKVRSGDPVVLEPPAVPIQGAPGRQRGGARLPAPAAGG